MKWTHKSIRRLCRTLRRQGFSIGRTTVRRLLHQRKYCLRTNRKRLAGTHDKDRDRQFRYLVRQRHRYLKHGWPVISVDTKTKELGDCSKDTGLSHHAALALCRVLVVWARPWACCSRSRSSANRPSIARCVRTRYTVFCILR